MSAGFADWFVEFKRYRNIPKISPGLIFFKGPFWGAYFWRGLYLEGLSTEGNLRFKIDWVSLIVRSKFTVFNTLYLREIFQVQPLGGLYLKGRFNGGFFALQAWGAYIWRGLYMERLIFGILRYSKFVPKQLGVRLRLAGSHGKARMLRTCRCCFGLKSKV